MSKPIVNEDEALQRAIRMIAPGTALREAISMILQAGTGAVICLGDVNRLARLSEGGVELNAEMRPQLLYELCKMDGAIILNEEGTRIRYANRFLKPNTRIPSDETGTRHRVSQRIAAQAKCTVITVSQRRASVTIYCHGRKYAVRTVQALVNKVTQAMHTLERYIHALQNELGELTMRELAGWSTLTDACRVIQRREMAERIYRREVLPLIDELGDEGRMIRLQIIEMRKPAEDAVLVVRDYVKDRPEEQAIERLKTLSESEVLGQGNIAQILGYGSTARPTETLVIPRGYRILSMLGGRFPDVVIRNLVERFGNLQEILRASKEHLVQVEGVGDVMAERILSGLDLLKKQYLMESHR